VVQGSAVDYLVTLLPKSINSVVAKLSANWTLRAQGSYQFAALEQRHPPRRRQGDFGVRHTS